MKRNAKGRWGNFCWWYFWHKKSFVLNLAMETSSELTVNSSDGKHSELTHFCRYYEKYSVLIDAEWSWNSVSDNGAEFSAPAFRTKKMFRITLSQRTWFAFLFQMNGINASWIFSICFSNETPFYAILIGKVWLQSKVCSFHDIEVHLSFYMLAISFQTQRNSFLIHFNLTGMWS